MARIHPSCEYIAFRDPLRISVLISLASYHLVHYRQGQRAWLHPYLLHPRPDPYRASQPERRLVIWIHSLPAHLLPAIRLDRHLRDLRHRCFGRARLFERHRQGQGLEDRVGRCRMHQRYRDCQGHLRAGPRRCHRWDHRQVQLVNERHYYYHRITGHI